MMHGTKRMTPVELKAITLTVHDSRLLIADKGFFTDVDAARRAWFEDGRMRRAESAPAKTPESDEEATMTHEEMRVRALELAIKDGTVPDEKGVIERAEAFYKFLATDSLNAQATPSDYRPAPQAQPADPRIGTDQDPESEAWAKGLRGDAEAA